MGKSSLPLQILLYFNRWYTVLWFLVELGAQIYKGFILPFPSNTFGIEVAMIFLYILVDLLRNFFGTKGNKAHHTPSLFIFFILTVPIIFGNVYYTHWQIYVYVWSGIGDSAALANILFADSIWTLC